MNKDFLDNTKQYAVILNPITKRYEGKHKSQINETDTNIFGIFITEKVQKKTCESLNWSLNKK